MVNASYLVRQLNRNIQDLPDGFYDTFDYTKRGNNLTHPITLGILTKIILEDDSVFRPAIDLRLNRGNKIKFQPDIVVLNKELKPTLYVDYESPNSCDCRIPCKDVNSYLRWSEDMNELLPYFIITTLPDGSSPEWQLRYVNKLNRRFKHRKEEMCQNPFRFWYTYYKAQLPPEDISRICFLNISGKSVSRVSLNRDTL
jgi:hypothetical protein